jgi:hypothetical protein
MPQPDRWGPFEKNLDPAERQARLRVLRVLALVFLRRCPGGRELANTLARAERETPLLYTAFLQFEELPALPKRRVLATYADLIDGRW